VTTTTDAPTLEFEDFAVTGPGVYDIPEDVYHADPVPGGSLSSTGARLLIEPAGPAKFDWARRHNKLPTEAMEFGTAAHHQILGTGAEVVPIEAENYQTKKAQQARDEARERGAVPMLPHQLDALGAMAKVLREHPLASALLTGWGRPEQSAFWRDKETGVICRSRYDVFPTGKTVLGRVLVPDYKTAKDAGPEAFAKAVNERGYHQQAPFYLDGLRALGLADEDAAFAFVVQEKTPPYLVAVYQLDAAALMIGAYRNRKALRTYAECTASGRWPGYSEDIETVSLPAWVEKRAWEDEEL
jgi:hypothetical protein